HLWYATAGDGLAAYLYAPCTVTAKVAGGVEVTIEERTRYPFEEKVEFRVTTAKPVKFPLYLRDHIGSVRINNTEVVFRKGGRLPKEGGEGICIDREWRTGDGVELGLPMVMTITEERNGTATVKHGPLTYS